MDLFDFFFPEQAQATHLRKLAHVTARIAQKNANASDEVDALRRENSELRLYLTAITELLVEKGLIAASEVQTRILTLLPPLAPAAAPEAENPFTDFNR